MFPQGIGRVQFGELLQQEGRFRALFRTTQLFGRSTSEREGAARRQGYNESDQEIGKNNGDDPESRDTHSVSQVGRNTESGKSGRSHARAMHDRDRSCHKNNARGSIQLLPRFDIAEQRSKLQREERKSDGRGA